MQDSQYKLVCNLEFSKVISQIPVVVITNHINHYLADQRA